MFYILPQDSSRYQVDFDSFAFTEEENEIIEYGRLLVQDPANIPEELFEKLKKRYSEEQIVLLTAFGSMIAYMGGMNTSIRQDAMIKLNPDYKQLSLQIYLNEDVNAEEFVKELESLYSDLLLSTLDMDKTIELGAGVYVTIISKVGIAILIVTIAVVILVLYFVINSSVVRRKRELGIQKAIGFTTFQLMNQISLGFLPPIIIGVCIGSILGITQTNAIMSSAQRAMSIMKANYKITPGWIALFGVVIVIVSYFTSMLITYRIRKISAFALVSE